MTSPMRLLAALGLMLGLAAAPAFAAPDPQIDASVHMLQTQWEKIKFTVPEGSTQTDQMNALGAKADALAASHPGSVELKIWDGIITSERASMTNPVSALLLARRARDILETAYKMDPAALDAGATTSLGVLYYRVPGFPIGFGDKTRARKLLEQATRLAPQGMDAWYFYGDFLMNEKEMPQAVAAFEHALAIPKNPDRPLWDANRRLLMQQLITKIKAHA